MQQATLRVSTLLLFVLQISIFVTQSSEGSEISDLTDQELQEEMRRRSVGGPWSSEEAVSIFNQAIDILSKPSNSRSRKYSSEALFLIETLTDAAEDVQPLDDDVTDSEEDEEFMEEMPDTSTSHVASQATMKKIIDMLDGSNGQSQRSHASISKLYPWYGSYMAPRFRKKT